MIELGPRLRGDDKVVRYLVADSIGLAVLSMLSGLFARPLLQFVELRVPDIAEIRWLLIVGLPVLLFLSYAWLGRQPARGALAVVLQCAGQVAMFLAPYCWLARHGL